MMDISKKFRLWKVKEIFSYVLLKMHESALNDYIVLSPIFQSHVRG